MPSSASTRRRSPWLRRLVLTLVVLIVLLVIADRGGDWVAERIAADNLQSSQHLGSRPDVDIHGVPFLTQFARGRYDHITVDAKNIPVAQGGFAITSLHVELHQLSVSRDFQDFHVATATATAFVDYQALSDRLGVTVAYAGNHRIRASKTIDLPGTGSVTPSISVEPVLVNGALGFGKATINGAGTDLGAVSAVLNDIFDVKVPLDGIPFQVKVRTLSVDARGLTLELAGADLSYSAGSGTG